MVDVKSMPSGGNWRFLGFPDGSVSKEPACNAGDTGDAGLIPGPGRGTLGGGNGNSLQYFLLKNSMDRGAWWATELGVRESNTTE